MQAYYDFLQKAVDNPGQLIPCENKEVDDYWHDQILDTRNYQKDCFDRFGVFVHHVPEGADCSSIVVE